MVALLNTRIDQDSLMPVLEVTHPALLPVMGESLLYRNCRILAESGVESIYVIVSQRPEELEHHLSQMDISVPVNFIVQPEAKSLAVIVREMSSLFAEKHPIYIPSQLVLSGEMVQPLVAGEGTSQRMVTMGHLPYILNAKEYTPTAYAQCDEGEVVDSIESLISINRSESLKRKCYSDGVIMEGVNIAAKPLKLAVGTSLRNTILCPGVVTGRFENLENVLVTPQATFNMETGEILPRRNFDTRTNLVRVIDMISSGIGLLMLLPLFLLVALLIKCDSKGPIFYRSARAVSPDRKRFGVRSGMKEVPFTVFRTMYVNADQMVHSSELSNRYGTGPYKKFDNDCRITRIGNFLRKTSLDELPLLWHVFTGDLSLVGTWALPKYEAKAIDEVPLVINDIDFTEVGRARFEGTAGIAGLWQSGGRSDLPAEERAVLDAVQTAMESSLYRSAKMPNIRHSLKGYMGMIVTTIRSVILCRGAQ